MSKKHDIEVVIQNKRYTICGYESEEYLQRIASYLNGHYAEYKDKMAYKCLDADTKNILMQINLADDYFKAEARSVEIEKKYQQQSEEFFEIKHDIVAVKTQLEDAKKELERLKNELDEANRKIFMYESIGKR